MGLSMTDVIAGFYDGCHRSSIGERANYLEIISARARGEGERLELERSVAAGRSVVERR